MQNIDYCMLPLGEKKKGASRLLGYENEVHFGKRRRLLPLVTFHPRPAPPLVRGTLSKTAANIFRVL